LSDDQLTKMLDDALAQRADRDATAKSAKQKLEEELKVSGEELKARVVPRLLAAQAAWKGKLNLEITDQSQKVGISGANQIRTNPSITVSATDKEHSSYSFETHHPGYASVKEGTGRNRGNAAYEFHVEKMSDLTNQKIDEILEAMVQEALGLKPRR
jgi:hypothetical protein